MVYKDVLKLFGVEDVDSVLSFRLEMEDGSDVVIITIKRLLERGENWKIASVKEYRLEEIC